HHPDHLGMHPLGGGRARRFGLVAGPGDLFEDGLAHLRAPRVVETDEQDARHQSVLSGTPMMSRRRVSPPRANARISSLLPPIASKSRCEPVSGGASEAATEGSRSRSVWRTTSAISPLART